MNAYLSDKDHPIALALFLSGVIKVFDGEYFGRASDGTLVSLGTVGYEDALEEYLKTHPTRNDW